MSHLKLKHPRKLTWAFLASIGGAVIVASGLARMGQGPRPLFYAGGVLVPLIVAYFFSRRFEFAADATAVQLTGDPEASITSLVKLNRLNLLPIHWSKWNEKFLTHPSTMRRVRAIAGAAQIPVEQVPEMVRASDRAAIQHASAATAGAGAKASGNAEESERYALPQTITPEGKLFSSAYKQRAALRALWALFAALTIPPALVANVAKLESWAGSVRWLVYVAGLALTFVIYLLVVNFASVSGNRALHRQLRARLERQGLRPAGCSGWFVGFSPDSRPRNYEGNSVWDIWLLVSGRRPTLLLRRGSTLRSAPRADHCRAPGTRFPGVVGREQHICNVAR